MGISGLDMCHNIKDYVNRFHKSWTLNFWHENAVSGPVFNVLITYLAAGSSITKLEHGEVTFCCDFIKYFPLFSTK